jgi:hypothetical protein
MSRLDRLRTAAAFGYLSPSRDTFGLSLGSLNPLKLIDKAMGGKAKPVVQATTGKPPADLKYSLNVKKTVQGNLTGIAAGTAALATGGIALPAVGASVAGGAVVANKLVAGVKAGGTAAKQAKATLSSTAKLAASGNVGAKNALALVDSAAKKANVSISIPKPPVALAPPKPPVVMLSKPVVKPAASKPLVAAPKPLVIAPRPPLTTASKPLAAPPQTRQPAPVPRQAFVQPPPVMATAVKPANQRKPVYLAPGKIMADAPSLVRWLVRDSGQVLKGGGSGSGFAVYADGRVVRQ